MKARGGTGFLALLLLLGAATPAWPLQTFREVRDAYRPSEAYLLDRRGSVIHAWRTDPRVRRLAWTPLERISPALCEATVQVEDRRFFTHPGVDLLALGSATLRAVLHGEIRGGSTLTMQLASLLDPSLRGSGGRRGPLQKVRQILAALWMERHWSKEEILEAYLNLVSFRGELQGIGSAARGLFGKEPHGLDRAEALLLTALIPSPNRPVQAVAKRAARLEKVLGWSVGQEHLQELSHCLVPRHDSPRPAADLAPLVARRLLARPGDTVQSTLDADLQWAVRESLRQHLLPLASRRVGEGAVLAVENQTGRVLAYVTHTNHPFKSGHVDAVAARRQAGSTLKPFLYAKAFDSRILTPASPLEDSPLDLPLATGIYRPGNYDGAFHGSVPARLALASSMNIPAVRTLELVGIEAFLRTLRDLGFQGLLESGDFYGPALALGSGDVSLWELVRAYRTLANKGVQGDLTLTPLSTPPPLGRVFSEEAAFLVSDILSDREARSATFGLENPIGTRFWAAVKTGTSKEMRDNWCVGYSENYTVGVWVGNVTGEPMWAVSGLTGAAPVWLDIMKALHRERGSGPGAPPPGLVRGGDGGGGPARGEWFLEGTEPGAEPPEEAKGPLRISYPPQGALFLLDPDIPEENQRILFMATGGAAEVSWTLDGRSVAAGPAPVPWKPVKGRHELVLADGSGRERDRVRFEVR